MDTKQLLQYAVNEISGLRNQNETMRNRLEVYDGMMQMFQTTPRREDGMMHPDVLYELNKEVKRLEEEKSNEVKGKNDD